MKLENEKYESLDFCISHYFKNHWIRTTTETLVKIGDFEELIVTSIDYRLEITFVFKKLYEKTKY